MSWSAPAYPPSHRRSSRSRSPHRGGLTPGRTSYPDTAYPMQDSYRPDWDYERDRAWASYDRERAAYDYGRRGRSRSPLADENGRKRRRSISPYERDRYEPRPRYGDDYDTHSRGYGYTSPRRSGQYSSGGGYPHSRRGYAPPDPHTFDHPATLKQYAEWFRYYYPQQAIIEDNADKAAEQEAGDGSKPRNGIRSKWEKYKREFAATQLQTMFDHHRKSPWFAEKYDPAEEMQALRKRVRKEGWRGRLTAFLHDLETGTFDPDLREPEDEATSSVKESSSNGVVGDSGAAVTGSADLSVDTNGAAASAAREESKVNAGDDEMQFAMEAEEEAPDHDLNRPEANGKPQIDTKRTTGSSQTRGEEVFAPLEGNQVMIRTIPPDIGRIKLEEACSHLPGFIYLALGDPLQKRNYYRAGWIRFRDDTDMAAVMSELSEKKIEGFKLHVTHNTRPFVNKLRYTPEVASRPDRLERDLANVRKLAAILEDEATALRKLPVKCVKQDDPTPRAVKTEDHSSDMTMTDGGEGGDDDDPEPPERGSNAIELRVEKIMAELREQGLVEVNNQKVYEARKTVISLDLYLAYLRAAFNACYYCSIVTDHLEELQRKCLKHVRKPLSKMLLEEVKAAEAEKEKEKHDDEPPKEKERDALVPKEKSDHRDWKRNDERWLEWFDSKIALLINRDGVDPREYGGKSYDEELTKAVEPFIKQEDEGKFRCKTCLKLFKATSFVEKHIANKHPELVKNLDEIPYFNNFALDPHRIQPFAYPPAPIGNSQMCPPQAYGFQGPSSDYNRSGGEYHRSSYSQGYPASHPGNNASWEPYFYPPYAYPLPPQLPSRRDEAMTARRLSDRISGYASGHDQSMEPSIIPAAAGLPPKPAVAADSAPTRRGGRGVAGGAPPPPPPDSKEDPRAASGKKVSYHDMDLVAEGDVELTY